MKYKSWQNQIPDIFDVVADNLPNLTNVIVHFNF